MNPSDKFDMHEVNRLIMREQIPGFKMLPSEEKYLAEYRKALKEFHGYEDKNETDSSSKNKHNTKAENRKADAKNKKNNRKHAEERVEQPVEEAEQLEPAVELINLMEVPEAEIVSTDQETTIKE